MKDVINVGRGRPVRYPTERDAEVLRQTRQRLRDRDPEHEPHHFPGTAVLAARLENA